MYRLEVFSPWRGWYVHALGPKFRVLDEWAYQRLQPSGPFKKYRIKKARKTDVQDIHAGLYVPAEDNPDVLVPVPGL